MARKQNAAEAVEETNETESPEEQKVDEVKVAFDQAVAEEKTEDEVKMAMIGAGATFKNVGRLYNKYMVDAGLAVSKEEKDEVVSDTLGSTDDPKFDVSEEEGFNSAVTALVENLKGSNDKSAAAIIRAWAKKGEIECFKKAKGGGGGRKGFTSKFYAALIENPEMSEEDAAKMINEDEDSSDNVRRHTSHFQAIRKMVNAIAAK